jgi:hypothetical protein
MKSIEPFVFWALLWFFGRIRAVEREMRTSSDAGGGSL